MDFPVKNTPLKVSQVTSLIKNILEQGFPDLYVEGEISNCRPSSTGHLYFSLKDNNSLLSCVMFRMQLRALGFNPKDGDLVRVRGSLSVYAPRGSYQLIVRQMNPVGTGKILAMLEERKRNYQALGWFDNKKPIPRFPQKIGIVTSPTGAAIQDMIRVFKKSAAPVNVLIFPAAVQGKASELSLAQQIKRANRFDDLDVIIVTRGGGSLEDLLPFSSEPVVEAVYNSRIPVISAVGHEIDWALSDFAADTRAATPTAAAEAAITHWAQYADRLEKAKDDLTYFMKAKIDRVRDVSRIFKPEEILRSFQSFLQPYYFRLDDYKEKIQNAMLDKLSRYKHRIEKVQGELQALDPGNVLKRGYALVWNQEGQVIADGAKISPKEELTLQFRDGKIKVETEG